GAAADFRRETKDHLIPGQSAIQHRINREPTTDNGTRNRRTVWTIATKPFAEAHFAVFPPELPEICIKAGSPEGGMVLDPFAGAGTTLMVALQLGREAIGIELNAEYCELIERRLTKVLTPS
ncbi:MAG TPA: site-specific DNA-methyltransferase, partial [Armatimonadota bacterium]|nr:site-specific DNA-methyltransferase [Armatimonadota bacterium]